jgi:hypothetical protein
MSITNLSMIDTNIAEGRLLLAALAKLTTESQKDKTPDEVISQCNELAAKMFGIPVPDEPAFERPEFGKALSRLINSYSKENESDTPDFILAEYLESSLNAFDIASKRRDKWYQPPVIGTDFALPKVP